MSEFVWAYNVRGEKHLVPAHWPTEPGSQFSDAWSKTPSQKAAENKAPARGDNTTKKGK